MAHRLPPTRIAIDPEASQVLRAMVNHARADLPDTATLSRLAARVDTAIAANVPVPEVAVTSGAASGALGLKLLGAVLIAGATAGGAVYWLRGEAPAATDVPSGAVASATSVVERPLDVTAPLQTTEESSPASEDSVRKDSTGRDSTGKDSTGDDSASSTTELTPTRHRPVVRDGASEVSLLDSARAKLRTDPNRALELTREHARRFPNGALVQEREVIAIEALRRLGKSDAAKKRGEDFSQHYPDSAHQSKIEQTLKGN